MKNCRIRKFFMILVFGIVAITVFSTVVMGLWNAILPAVLGVKTITFIQALGILLLSKILFGGFGPRGGCGWHGGRAWKMRMKEKFKNMTPEEREKIKAAWKDRCGNRWKMDEEDDTNIG
jgi:hypothetical protein